MTERSFFGFKAEGCFLFSGSRERFFFGKTVAHFFIFIFCMLIVFKISCDGGNGGKF